MQRSWHPRATLHANGNLLVCIQTTRNLTIRVPVHIMRTANDLKAISIRKISVEIACLQLNTKQGQ